jgi:hypothetical protein
MCVREREREKRREEKRREEREREIERALFVCHRTFDKELQQKPLTETHLLAMRKSQRPEKKDLPHDSLRRT